MPKSDLFNLSVGAIPYACRCHFDVDSFVHRIHPTDFDVNTGLKLHV